MDKSLKKKLIKQIGQLCEKQYRKGFQQGYFVKKDNTLTDKEVNTFRYKGSVDNYKKVIDPVTGEKTKSLDRLECELSMQGMSELKHFLYN